MSIDSPSSHSCGFVVGVILVNNSASLAREPDLQASVQRSLSSVTKLPDKSLVSLKVCVDKKVLPRIWQALILYSTLSEVSEITELSICMVVVESLRWEPGGSDRKILVTHEQVAILIAVFRSFDKLETLVKTAKPLQISIKALL